MIKELVERFKRVLSGGTTFQIEGHVKGSIDWGDGREPEVFLDKKNLIVNSGRLIVLRSIYPTTPADALSYAKVGTGGATDTGGLFLKTPLPTQTDLYHPLTTCSMGSGAIDTVAVNRVLFAVLDNSQGNGSYINEVGFFAGTGDMFNIKTFPRILKTSDFSINFQWTITVV